MFDIENTDFGSIIANFISAVSDTSKVVFGEVTSKTETVWKFVYSFSLQRYFYVIKYDNSRDKKRNQEGLKITERYEKIRNEMKQVNENLIDSPCQDNETSLNRNNSIKLIRWWMT